MPGVTIFQGELGYHSESPPFFCLQTPFGGCLEDPLMNPFETLELKPGASAEDIKMAYHRLAKQWHPDRFEGEEKARAELRFREISEAFELLRDPVRRQQAEQQAGVAPQSVPEQSKAPVGERTPEDWYEEAKREAESGDSERALGLLQYAIRLDGRKPEFHVMLAQLMERLGKDQRQIVKSYEAAQQLNPKDVDVLIRLAEHYQALGMQVRAQRLLQEAREISPKHKYFKQAAKAAASSSAAAASEAEGGLMNQFKALVGRLTRKG